MARPHRRALAFLGFWVRQLLTTHRESPRWSISLHYRIASLQGRIAVYWWNPAVPGGEPAVAVRCSLWPRWDRLAPPAAGCGNLSPSWGKPAPSKPAPLLPAAAAPGCGRSVSQFFARPSRATALRVGCPRSYCQCGAAAAISGRPGAGQRPSRSYPPSLNTIRRALDGCWRPRGR
jgi:hypothetical protein